MIYLIYRIYNLAISKMYSDKECKNLIALIFFLISYLGILLVGIGDTFYCFGIIYILLGVGYAILYK